MRRRRSVSVSQFRLLKAVALVLAVLVAAPGVDAIVRYAVPAHAASYVDVGLDAGSLVGSGDPPAALERIEGAATPSGADVPAWFSGEVGFLSGARDVRADGGSVVGYLVEGNCGTVLDQLVEHMQSEGWTPVPLGGVEGATFVKPDGACTWVLATCTQVGDDASVVMRGVVE